MNIKSYLIRNKAFIRPAFLIFIFCLIISNNATASITRCNTVAACAGNYTDYLMMTAHDLYNSQQVDNLASHRSNINDFNIAIVDVENMSGYNFTYAGIHDFIQAVYNTQSAEHMDDGYLGYVLLIGDAFEDDNTTRMLWDYDEYGGDQQASDHFYACIYGADDYPDVFIGRLSVGNETELTNVVSKIVNYETVYTSGDWKDDILLFEGQGLANYSQFGSIDNYLQSRSQETFFLYHYTPAHATTADHFDQYNDVYTDINDATQRFINQLNAGKLIVNYEADHGSKFGLHPDGEGHYYTYFDVNDIANLSNGNYLPFMLLVCCQTGWFDNTTQEAQFGTNVDCLAEQLQYANNRGAIAVLASSRDDDTDSYNMVDRYVYEAIFNHFSTTIGEAVLEAKFQYWQSRRHRYNLFGDPALNLFPDGYSITQDITLSGTNVISTDLTVNAGVTLTISSGSILIFSPGARLTINGTIQADGATFTSANASPSAGDWDGIYLTDVGSSSSIEDCTIEYAYYGIYCDNSDPVIDQNTIQYCTNAGIWLEDGSAPDIITTAVSNCLYGIVGINSGPYIEDNLIEDNSRYGMVFTNYCDPLFYDNTIQSNGWDGAYFHSNCDPEFGANDSKDEGHNEIINNDGNGIFADDYCTVWAGCGDYAGYNAIYGNSGYDVRAESNSSVIAENNYWG